MVLGQKKTEDKKFINFKIFCMYLIILIFKHIIEIKANLFIKNYYKYQLYYLT